MSYQTYTAHKPPLACAAVTPSPPAATQWYRLLLRAVYGVRRTPYYALSMEDDSAVIRFYVPGDLDLWPLSLTLKHVPARDQTRRFYKFGANPFSRSRDIWVTNKQKTNKKTKLITDSAKNRTLLAYGNNNNGDLDLWPLTLAFKLVRARDQTCLPCELGANSFSGSRDISYTNIKVPDSAKNRTLRSLLRAVTRRPTVANSPCHKIMRS